MEKMESAKIRCWNKTHKKMKWKLALRIATSPSDRWLRKAAEWNQELCSRYRTNRPIGRPRKRLEDEINEFLKTSSNSADQLRSLGPKSDYDKDQKTEVSMFSVFMLTHDTLRSTGECAQISQSRNL